MRASLLVFAAVAAACNAPPQVQLPAKVCSFKATSTQLASAIKAPNQVALDAENIYWVSSSTEGTELWRASKQGTGAPERLIELPSGVSALAAHAGQVFFAQYGPKGVQTVANGSAQTLIGDVSVGELRADERGLWFVDTSKGAVMTAGHDGSGLKTVASGQRNPGRLVLDEMHAFWINVEGEKLPAYTVMVASRAGGEAKSLMGEHSSASGLALSTTHVYVSTGDRLLEISKGGEGLRPVLSMQRIAAPLLGEGPRLFWSESTAGGGRLMSFEPSVGTPVPVAETGRMPVAVVADSSGVYWFSTTSGGPEVALYRLCD